MPAPAPATVEPKHVHLFKWIPEELRHVRDDAGTWKYMGDVPSVECAVENIETAAANGHDYAYLAW